MVEFAFQKCLHAYSNSLDLDTCHKELSFSLSLSLSLCAVYVIAVTIVIQVAEAIIVTVMVTLVGGIIRGIVGAIVGAATGGRVNIPPPHPPPLPHRHRPQTSGRWGLRTDSGMNNVIGNWPLETLCICNYLWL